MRSDKILIILGFIVISVIWGSTWLAIKIGLESIPPLYGVAIRFSLAVLILSLIMFLRKEKLLLDRNSIIVYITLGISSFSIPFALVYWSEQYISSGLASILFAVYPLVVAVLSHIFLSNEPLNPFKITGILIGFIGVLIIFWKDIHIGDVNTLAMGAIILSTVLQGISLVIVKRRGMAMNPISMNCGGMIIGIVVMYSLALMFEDYSKLHFDEKGLGSILYLGTFGTVVTFVTYYWLLKRVEAVYLSLTSLITPIVAVFLGTIILYEDLSPQVFLGAALVLLGLLITNGRDLIEILRKQSFMIASQKDLTG
ncbi:MAG TPA: DMT family transporter [Bacteroidota bacterium]|nr:DMT family transporter [Bacteroidota bacterium]